MQPPSAIKECPYKAKKYHSDPQSCPQACGQPLPESAPPLCRFFLKMTIGAATIISAFLINTAVCGAKNLHLRQKNRTAIKCIFIIYSIHSLLISISPSALNKRRGFSLVGNRVSGGCFCLAIRLFFSCTDGLFALPHDRLHVNWHEKSTSPFGLVLRRLLLVIYSSTISNSFGENKKSSPVSSIIRYPPSSTDCTSYSFPFVRIC